jgi:hypothetical protein
MMVEEMVRVAHFDVARVKQLVDAHPALARAAVDWGFGDWEDALGASSHMGRYDIAEILLSHGARPSLFSAAMMGRLETVKALIQEAPGSQRILGPHGITLLAHAKAGGDRALAVRKYLEELGDADISPSIVALPDMLARVYVGTYRYGTNADDRLEVAAQSSGGLTITRPGLPFARGMRHLGNHEFFPMGAEAVRIQFAVSAGQAISVSVLDPDPLVIARRTP